MFPTLRALPYTVDIYYLRSYTGDNDLTKGFDDNITKELNRDMTEVLEDEISEDWDDDEFACNLLNIRIRLSGGLLAMEKDISFMNSLNISGRPMWKLR